MRFPTEEQVGIALMWLRSNEGEAPERPACVAVADWLEAYERDRELRLRCRQAGVPISRVRERLRNPVK